MVKLLAATDHYFQSMNWQKFSLLKTCCIAFGVMLACFIPEKQKKNYLLGASALFTLTYIPIMLDFLSKVKKIDEEMYVS